jgi:16S rRNA (guanine966-N2)-methyltransferase
MRIVAGALRGRPLVAPKGHLVRPTSDRARQAIFNLLEHAAWAPRLDGARVLDLFAGSGAMGLEAMSRGAAYCRFVELSEDAAAAIRTNAARLDLAACTAVDRRDATRLGARPNGQPTFDLVFVDPPYGEGLGEAALAGLEAGRWLGPEAVVVLERSRREAAESAPPGYGLLDERVWGAARISFLRPNQRAL